METAVNESLTFQWDTKRDTLIGNKQSDTARSDTCARKATTSSENKKQDFRYEYFLSLKTQLQKDDLLTTLQLISKSFSRGKKALRTAEINSS